MQEHTRQRPTAGDLRAMVAEILEIDAAEVAPDASFFGDLGMDSLQKTAVVVAMEQRFGVTLAPEEAADARSVADLLRLSGGEG
ncbi:acyl carrier protein [Actinomadura fibrosa]|uniref:Acyl carrier protein n=1 Tax=Actinomadura fibrosa TaxID=111802 RepID=A0ABW2XU70_9ACTN|nr:acyl carrier protein [Actinomadura fibrosa]